MKGSLLQPQRRSSIPSQHQDPPRQSNPSQICIKQWKTSSSMPISLTCPTGLWPDYGQCSRGGQLGGDQNLLPGLWQNGNFNLRRRGPTSTATSNISAIRNGKTCSGQTNQSIPDTTLQVGTDRQTTCRHHTNAAPKWDKSLSLLNLMKLHRQEGKRVKEEAKAAKLKAKWRHFKQAALLLRGSAYQTLSKQTIEGDPTKTYLPLRTEHKDPPSTLPGSSLGPTSWWCKWYLWSLLSAKCSKKLDVFPKHHPTSMQLYTWNYMTSNPCYTTSPHRSKKFYRKF